VWIAALVGALVVTFCVVGEFSKKEKVQGILMPEGGIVDVFSPESGVISQRLVEEGESVTKGQPLYVISTESNNLTDGGVRRYVGTLLEQDVERVQQQLAVNASITAQKQQALR
ncbi:HlyD family efflux transporter periplasmic adaptor subunit, partial [Vibrio natriegens]